MKKSNKQGFSLVELSIVLVVIGLLVASIVVGQDLIRGAKFRSISTEIEQYRTAYNLFQEKHLGVAGDLVNATSFYSTAPQGDGDGIVEYVNTNYTNNEGLAYWEHMSAAGLVPASYSGPATGAGIVVTLGTHIPKSGWDFAGWHVNSGTFAFAASKNVLTMGAQAAAGAIPAGAALIPRDAWQLDSKYDDGIPGSGLIRAGATTGTAADDACNNAGPVYDLSATALACVMGTTLN